MKSPRLTASSIPRERWWGGGGGRRERKEKLRKVGGWGEVGRVLFLLLITIKRNFLSASRLSLAAVYRQSLSKSSPLRPQLPVAAQATRILEFLLSSSHSISSKSNVIFYLYFGITKKNKKLKPKKMKGRTILRKEKHYGHILYT